MVKRGHEIDMEYSKKEIIDKMNSFFGYLVVEKLKFICFQSENENTSENYNQTMNVTKNKYQKKLSKVKNVHYNLKKNEKKIFCIIIVFYFNFQLIC